MGFVSASPGTNWRSRKKSGALWRPNLISGLLVRKKFWGLRADVADKNLNAFKRLLRAILRAARWADNPDNHFELATLLAQPEYVGVSTDILFGNLSGRPQLDPFRAARDIPALSSLP